MRLPPRRGLGAGAAEGVSGGAELPVAGEPLPCPAPGVRLPGVVEVRKSDRRRWEPGWVACGAGVSPLPQPATHSPLPWRQVSDPCSSSPPPSSGQGAEGTLC